MQCQVVHGFYCKFYDFSRDERILKIGSGLTKLMLIIFEEVYRGYVFVSPGIYNLCLALTLTLLNTLSKLFTVGKSHKFEKNCIMPTHVVMSTGTAYSMTNQAQR